MPPHRLGSPAGIIVGLAVVSIPASFGTLLGAYLNRFASHKCPMDGQVSTGSCPQCAHLLNMSAICRFHHVVLIGTRLASNTTFAASQRGALCPSRRASQQRSSHCSCTARMKPLSLVRSTMKYHQIRPRQLLKAFGKCSVAASDENMSKPQKGRCIFCTNHYKRDITIYHIIQHTLCVYM